MVDQVWEQLTADGHAETVHVREVRGTQPAGMMHLVEVDFLGGAVHGPPIMDAALQAPQLAVGEAAGMLPLEPGEEGLGLQAGGGLQLLLDGGPDVGEGIGPGAPIACRRRQLAGQAFQGPVPPCGFAVDADLGSGRAQGRSLIEQAEQPPHMNIRGFGHRKLLPWQGLR